MENNVENIKRVFEGIRLDATLTTGTRDFIASLRKHFKKHKKLSAKQFICLLEILNSQKK